MTSEIALIVSAISVAFSIFFGLKNNKRTDIKEFEERVKENTRINMKLDDIAKTTKDVQKELELLKNDIKNHSDRIVKVEESAKQGHKRLDTLEKRFGKLEEQILIGGK